ncbi:hypothetical protein LUZ61_002264 [Rhynchospora tenuis]|uniref:Uncharacterized protein n=1 Tax=Rhynchospora tenuis TaxID=198213 RepID=A0AAD6ERM2_9POAL|nr:hypothetical protein LUZ61_002264 [Rhynchospora tenuis]
MMTMEGVLIDSTIVGTDSDMGPSAHTNNKLDEPAGTNNSRKRNLRQRGGGIYYGVFDMSSDDELVFESIKKQDPYLGNPKQSNDGATSLKRSRHEKEFPQWHPDEGCRPQIEEAPVFYPTEEEFRDTLGYIARICPQAEKYGICCIVPPSTWTPPCPLREKDFWERVEFTTRVQQVDKLQNREPIKKRSKTRTQRRKRRRKGLRFGMNKRRNNNDSNNNSSNSSENKDAGNESDPDEKFGFQNGSDFTLEEFQEFADEFKERYFGIKNDIKCSHSDKNDSSCSSCENNNTHSMKKERWSPSVEEIEGEYWRIVEEADEEIEVHYGADLDTVLFGSGFPKATISNSRCESHPVEAEDYVLSGWNLNNLPRLPGSVLSFEKEEISGVVVPWLYVGMCFSSFCWHVEDHHLYSLNYMHFGEPKVWYGVAGSEATKLEEAMRKHLPELFEEQPDLLHELVTQLSPTVLKSEGVNVYRAVQRPGQFVLTFPRAYHSGFNCGFNCAEAVNVAPADWLPLGQCAVESYREQKRKTSISHDKLLLEVAKAAVREIWLGQVHEGNSSTERHRWKTACGKDGVLTKAFKVRIEMEEKARKNLNCDFQLKKIKNTNDTSTERECFSCFYDLHFSSIGCECNPSRFACLNHAELLCSCEPSKRVALIRYDLEELTFLLSALEGDLSAVKKWAEIDPGFRMSLLHKEINVIDLNTEEGSTKPEMGCTARSNSNCGATLSLISSSDLVQPGRGQICKTSPKLFGVDIGAALPHPVELLQIGMLMRGNNWSCKEAIFTKGYKSRVRFHSVLDPAKRCNYICEILDAGLLGPLFKVTLEGESKDICFTEASPNRCWDLVTKKLNAEISRLSDSSILVACGPVNGLEMFGFTSPNIIQALEALDPNCQCSNYWGSKSMASLSRDLCMKIPKTPEIQKICGTHLTKREEEKIYINCNSSPEELQMDKSTLQCLFSKASVDELKVMYRVFSSGSGSGSWRAAFEVLSATLSNQLMKSQNY